MTIVPLEDHLNVNEHKLGFKCPQGEIGVKVTFGF